MTRLARSNDPAQVLVIGPSWVGDMVMAQVLFQVMRRRWPRVQIDLLAPPASAPVGLRMAELRRVIPLEIPHGELAFKARRTLARELQPVDYDWAICLPNSFKSALIPYWMKIPVRTGFRREMRAWLLSDPHRLNRRKLPRTVDQYVALGLPPRLPQPHSLPAPRLQVDATARSLAWQEFALDPGPRVVALAPGPNMARPSAGQSTNGRVWPRPSCKVVTRSGSLVAPRMPPSPRKSLPRLRGRSIWAGVPPYCRPSICSLWRPSPSAMIRV